MHVYSVRFFIVVLFLTLFAVNGSLKAGSDSNTKFNLDDVTVENVNETDRSGRSRVFYAAEKGDLQTVKTLLDKFGADPKFSTWWNETVLHAAAKSGNEELVRLLVEKGADVNAIDKNGHAVLHRAGESKNWKIVLFLLEKGAKINISDKEKQTVLHLAAQTGNFELFKKLLAKGANLYAVTKWGQNILNCAAEGGNFELVKFLVEEKKMDPFAKTWTDQTNLHFAAQSGNLDLVKYFLEVKKLDISAKTFDSQTPLHYAAEVLANKIAEYLIEKGADLTAVNDDNLDVLFIASKSGNAELIQFLLKHGVKIDPKSEKGISFINDVVRTGQKALFHDLVKNQKFDPKTPFLLHSAAESGNLELVKYFVEQIKSNINEIDDMGYSVLRRSTLSPNNVNNIKIIEYLVEKDVDLNPPNVDHWSILKYAVQICDKVLYQYLVSKGARPLPCVKM